MTRELVSRIFCRYPSLRGVWSASRIPFPRGAGSQGEPSHAWQPVQTIPDSRWHDRLLPAVLAPGISGHCLTGLHARWVLIRSRLSPGSTYVSRNYFRRVQARAGPGWRGIGGAGLPLLSPCAVV